MKTISRRTAGVAALLAGSFAGVLAVRSAGAQDRPSPGVTRRLIVPFAAGGIADGLGRIVADILGTATHSSYVVENRSGGGGNVGAEIVARAPPNGQTLLLGTLGTAVTNQYIHRYVPYDSDSSFALVALVGEVANVIVVHPALPVDTLEGFVAHCKRRGPHEVSYGSPGIGSAGHLSMEHLQSQAGIALRHVAYDSRSRMIKDLLVGRIAVVMDNLPPYARHLGSGALRALGVSSTGRWHATPQVPSIAELGYPDYQASLWWYIAAPAGTPRTLVRRLSEEIVKAVGSEPIMRRIRDVGASPLPGTSEDLARHIESEKIKWKRVIDTARIEPQ